MLKQLMKSILRQPSDYHFVQLSERSVLGFIKHGYEYLPAILYNRIRKRNSKMTYSSC